MATHTPKRPNSEMSFSPEGPPGQDYLRTMLQEVMDKKLRQVLDEKFGEHIAPVKQEIAKLQQHIHVMKEKHESEIRVLKQENQKQKAHIEKLESYQRRNNIRFYNISENKDENLDQFLIEICNKYLESNELLDSRSFERAHRIGKFVSGKQRIVVARVAHYKEKVAILKARKHLNDGEKINISDDFTNKVEQRHRKLYPVMKAIKAKMGIQDRAKVYLKEDKICIGGMLYAENELDTLPDEYNLQSLFTPQRGEVTAFYTQFSPFSNHYLCDFKVGGEKYSSFEKYLFTALADKFGDHSLKLKITKEDNPVVIKRLGKNINNFDESIWQRDIQDILQQGLRCKFEQNPKLTELLLSTGDTKIAEASKFDRRYGVGLSLQDPDLWQKDKWLGQNRMGRALMAVRDYLKTGK